MPELLYPGLIIRYHQIILPVFVILLVLKKKSHTEYSLRRIRFTAICYVDILIGNTFIILRYKYPPIAVSLRSISE